MDTQVYTAIHVDKVSYLKMDTTIALYAEKITTKAVLKLMRIKKKELYKNKKTIIKLHFTQTI